MKRLLLSRLSKKQWLIIGVALAIIATVIIGALVITKQRAHREALRQDKEKFTQLDAKMQKVFDEFKKVAPEGEWKYEKACSRTGGEFENYGDTKFCNLTVQSDRNLFGQFDTLAKIVEDAGFPLENIYKSERTQTISRFYKNEVMGMYCHLSSRNSPNAQPATFFNCDVSALDYYYPYVH